MSLVLVGLASLWGCGGQGTSTPSPTAPTGNYTLVVEASGVCRFAVSRFQWDLEATATGSGPGAAVRATLPGGNATVDVSITQAKANARVNGSITTRAALQEHNKRVTITGGARGALTMGPGGRGQVLNGVLNGTIVTNTPEEDEHEGTHSHVIENCTAADHKWTLVPR